eukprot:980574-Rhodomonas_salina.1
MKYCLPLQHDVVRPRGSIDWEMREHTVTPFIVRSKLPVGDSHSDGQEKKFEARKTELGLSRRKSSGIWKGFERGRLGMERVSKSGEREAGKKEGRGRGSYRPPAAPIPVCI